MDKEFYKDLFGRQIQVGDYIVYSALDGRSGVLRVGKVLELTESKEVGYYNHKKDPKIKIKSLCFSYYNYKNPTRNKPEKQKDTFLSFFERIMVVHKEQLTKEIVDLLE